MRRWLLVAVLVVLSACSTGESATETTKSDVASPSSPSTLTEDTTPGSPTSPSEPSTPQSPQTTAGTSDITFTATANPDTLVAGTPAEDAGSIPAIIAVDKASGKSAWHLDVPSAGWYWLQESAGMLIYSSQGEDASSIIAAVDLEGRPIWKTTTSWRTHGPFLPGRTHSGRYGAGPVSERKDGQSSPSTSPQARCCGRRTSIRSRSWESRDRSSEMGHVSSWPHSMAM